MKGIVWYLNHYAGGPGIGRAHRAYHLGRYWSRAGYQVWVISASYHHLLDDEESRQGDTVVDGVNYLFIDTPRYQGNGVGRIRNMLTYSFGLLRDRRLSNGIAGTPNVIVASSPHPYAIPFAGYLARRFRCRLIVEVRDLWPDSLVQLSGLSAAHPLVLFTGIFERYAYRRADHLVSLIPLAETLMRERGLGDDRFSYIPNGASFNDAESQAEPAVFPLLTEVMRSSADGYFNLCYAGALGKPNNLDCLLDAAALLEEEGNPKVRIFVVGKGDQRTALEKKGHHLGLRNLVFREPISKREVLTLLPHMNAGFISLKTKPLFRYGVSPNKLFDYMRCRLPVIFAIEAGNNPVQDAACGFCVSPDSSRQLAETIEKLAAMPASERTELGENGFRYLAAHHDYSVLAKRFMELFPTYDQADI